MSWFVLLDAGPLGLVTGSRSSAATVACQGWLEGLLSASVQVRVADIADAVYHQLNCKNNKDFTSRRRARSAATASAGAPARPASSSLVMAPLHNAPAATTATERSCRALSATSPSIAARPM